MAASATKTRYGIGEWFGRDVAGLTRTQRATSLALAESKSTLTAPCPFAAALNPQATCSKPGGVCTIRKYEQHTKGVRASPEPPVTVCPQRFLQDAALIRWAGAVMLGTNRPEVADGPAFWAEISHSSLRNVGFDRNRLGLVLIHPDKRAGLRRCWVATQASHLPERAKKVAFQVLDDAEVRAIPFHSEIQRPNFGRTGLVRLSAHLNRTVPVVRDFGAKAAVIVDEFFFTKIQHVRGLTGKQAIELADVVWLVPRYEQGRLVPGQVVYTQLDDSIRALLAPPSVGKEAFENSIRQLLADPKQRGIRVFQL